MLSRLIADQMQQDQHNVFRRVRMLLQTPLALLTASAERRTVNQVQTLSRKVAIGVLATLLLALCAHISILLPFTPIPITMQTFAVLVLGMVLGPLAGMGVMALYLVEGALGLPVFSPHGVGGLAQLLGPSGGYLLSYPFAALLSGALFTSLKSTSKSFLASLMAAVVGDAIIIFSGALWLGVSLRLSFIRAFEVGAMPFLAGEMIKAALIAATLAALQRTQKAE